MSAKNISRREFLKIAGVGMGATVLVACGGKPPATSAPTVAPTVISPATKKIKMLAHTTPATETFKRMGAIFKQQTGIDFQVDEGPFNDLQGKVMTDLLSGAASYDVIPMYTTMMLGAASYVDDVSSVITGDLKTDILTSDIDDCKDAKGVLRGVPTQASMPAYFYRTDLLSQKGMKPPTTWDEFLQASQAMTVEASGSQPKTWGYLMEASTKNVRPGILIISWFLQNGGAMQDANGKPAFNSDANVEALQFWVDLVHKYKVTPPEATEMTHEDVHNLFIQGRGGSAINHQYMVGMALTSDQSTVKDKFAVAATPKGKAGHGAMTDHWMLTVPSTSKNKDAAKEFIKVALSVAGQKDLLKSEGLVVRQSAMDPNDPEVKAANPFIGAWLEEMKFASAYPRWTAINDVFTRLAFGINQAVSLIATPKQALDNAQKEAEALVK